MDSYTWVNQGPDQGREPETSSHKLEFPQVQPSTVSLTSFQRISRKSTQMP